MGQNQPKSGKSLGCQHCVVATMNVMWLWPHCKMLKAMAVEEVRGSDHKLLWSTTLQDSEHRFATMVATISNIDCNSLLSYFWVIVSTMKSYGRDHDCNLHNFSIPCPNCLIFVLFSSFLQNTHREGVRHENK